MQQFLMTLTCQKTFFFLNYDWAPLMTTFFPYYFLSTHLFCSNLDLSMSTHELIISLLHLLPLLLNLCFTFFIPSYILYTSIIPVTNYMHPDSPPIWGSWHFLMDMAIELRVYLCFFLLYLSLLTFLTLSPLCAI